MAVWWVYLIHCRQPIGQAQSEAAREAYGLPPRKGNWKGPQARHYLGITNSLRKRMEQHAAGNGSHFMAAVAAAGIEWERVRVWRCESKAQARQIERRLKKRHNSKNLCPVCRDGHPAPGNSRAVRKDVDQ